MPSRSNVKKTKKSRISLKERLRKVLDWLHQQTAVPAARLLAITREYVLPVLQDFRHHPPVIFKFPLLEKALRAGATAQVRGTLRYLARSEAEAIAPMQRAACRSLYQEVNPCMELRELCVRLMHRLGWIKIARKTTTQGEPT